MINDDIKNLKKLKEERTFFFLQIDGSYIKMKLE